MTDRDAILSAVLEHPADDTARLVLADFLREQSDPSDVALGRFLWAGVVASRYRDAGVIEEAEYYTALAELTAVAEQGWPARWLAALGMGPSAPTARDWAWDSTADRVTFRFGALGGEFERGMLTGLTLAFGEWMGSASRALAAWPLAWVVLPGTPGVTLRIAPPGPEPGWRRTAEVRLRERRVPLAGGPVVAALSPFPALVEPAATLSAHQSFPDRAALVQQADAVELLVNLRDQAGDRWPPSAPRLLG